MPIQTLTQHTFDRVVHGHPVVFVDWWAGWCEPCRHFEPVFQESARRHPEIVYATVDSEAERALVGMAGVSQYPTLMVFRDGLMVYSGAGYLAPDQLEDLVQQVIWLDMDEVRREVARQADQEQPQQNAPAPPAPARPRAGVAGPIGYGWPGL
ncbi:thioredoxin [Nocardia panacis]|uniref:Thioredoxin n=1 Tax=Nocardia panacis TaxID=2340916 RepID=A0A3A4K504_9NOCA|nr:thioredoxin family protein [Nocardia panacis]RJO73531.1 thioredoxin [Nocardia panacis]